MSNLCQYTGKKPSPGYKYTTRGIAKKNKGIGLNITGKAKRIHHPNVMKKRIWLPEEKRFVTLKLSANALRTMNKIGVTKVVAKMRKQGQKI